MPDDISQLMTAAMRANSPTLPRGETALAAALAQLSGQPGKLLRARLVLSTARSLGWVEEPAVNLAVAVEYFHVASLVRPNFALALGIRAARGRLERLNALAQQSLARLAPAGAGRWSGLATFHAEALAALSAQLTHSAA